MGHGFGLNHADENFNNADLHTCMDYTNHPENNQTPNENDYSILFELYGAEQQRNRDRDNRVLNLRSNWKWQIEDGELPPFVSFTDNTHRQKWRLLKKFKGREIHELDLGRGNRMRALVLLADTDDAELN